MTTPTRKRERNAGHGLPLEELVAYLDGYLRTAEVPDYPNAVNGVQIEGSGDVERIGLAVDASERAIHEGVVQGCQLLIVHHGLFWDGQPAITGRRYRKLKACIEGGLAVYASHIPLDLHPEVGNSVVLARALGVEVDGWWGDFQGVPIGVQGNLSVTRETLAARLDELLGGRIHLLPGGPEQIDRVGVLTGAGGSMINEAIGAGLDALVTGEGAHHTYFDAVEGGINVYYGGHYATETWGLRALGQHLTDRFGTSVVFIDVPTGL